MFTSMYIFHAVICFATIQWIIIMIKSGIDYKNGLFNKGRPHPILCIACIAALWGTGAWALEGPNPSPPKSCYAGYTLYYTQYLLSSELLQYSTYDIVRGRI